MELTRFFQLDPAWVQDCSEMMGVLLLARPLSVSSDAVNCWLPLKATCLLCKTQDKLQRGLLFWQTMKGKTEPERVTLAPWLAAVSRRSPCMPHAEVSEAGAVVRCWTRGSHQVLPESFFACCSDAGLGQNKGAHKKTHTHMPFC